MARNQLVEHSPWKSCLQRLERDLPEQQLNTWIRPLQAVESENLLILLAPNRFVLDWVKKHHLASIQKALSDALPDAAIKVQMEIGSNRSSTSARRHNTPTRRNSVLGDIPAKDAPQSSNLNPDFVFDNFIEGKSNQMARAACLQVSQNPGKAYNPLCLYGGTGLGKTHLMHAVGNTLRHHDPKARILYQHSEHFVANMVRALQHNTINRFKQYYRNLDALLIDDIQFFAKKERSQEEFFHTFNSLLEGHQQVILTCDRYPREVGGVEERLKSRFGWGLTVAIEPPELETRVAILMKKAQQSDIDLPDEVGFFIAQRIRSNVRELEGALRRVQANSQFTGQTITLAFTKEALSDLINLHDKLVTIENIKKTVADYYKIRVTDLCSNSRLRAFSRPRQIAMTLAKDLTSHSLPEIGEAFGGRDHTTVLHANRKIKELQAKDETVRDDFSKLMLTLST